MKAHFHLINQSGAQSRYQVGWEGLAMSLSGMLALSLVGEGGLSSLGSDNRGLRSISLCTVKI